jgi:hypothetical protein
MMLHCKDHPRYLAVRAPKTKGKLTCHCWLLYGLRQAWNWLRKYVPLPVLKVGIPYIYVVREPAQPEEDPR